MKIQIGMKRVARELDIDVDMTAEDVYASVATAISENSVLRFADKDGKTVMVPASSIAYVSAAHDEPRRVGFGFAN